MPEGDTIYRSAQRLQALLLGTITTARVHQSHLDSSRLQGKQFTRIEARGKHLLMYLDDGSVIHSHMGMTGSWHLYQPGEPWRKSPRSAALTVTIESESRDGEATQFIAVCFAPKTLKLLSATQFRRHPYLQRLGPDLMKGEFDGDQILGRFRVHNLAPIGEAVMNQTIVSGIGNIYKSEVLFLTATNPFVRVGDLGDSQILRIAEFAQDLMRKNQFGGPRKTRFGGRSREHLWVYGRSGKGCFRCEAIIEMRRQGDLGRSTYWCPSCQKRVKKGVA